MPSEADHRTVRRSRERARIPVSPIARHSTEGYGGESSAGQASRCPGPVHPLGIRILAPVSALIQGTPAAAPRIGRTRDVKLLLDENPV